MKNIEKYKNEVAEAVKDPRRGSNFMKEHVYPFYGVHGTATAFADSVLLTLWLNEEYKEPEVDWTQVEVDTPILVKSLGDTKWEKKHFAKYEGGKVYAWDNGTTSWTQDTSNFFSSWECAKLAIAARRKICEKNKFKIEDKNEK